MSCLMFSKVSNDGREQHQSIQVLESPRLAPRDHHIITSLLAPVSQNKNQNTCKTMCAMNELCEFSLVSKPNDIDNIYVSSFASSGYYLSELS